jgi:segregation and condensation protein B
MTNMASELSDEMAREEPNTQPAEPLADAVTQVADEDSAAEIAEGARALPFDVVQRIVEGALLAAGKPLAVEDIAALFDDDERPAAQEIRAALAAIAGQCAGRGFELREVASGFRFQIVQDVAPWIARLWEEKPQKYSRALLETLALIAYRQPITRGDIEDIRGVAVATNIIKTLLEREWVRVVGHKDVPGRPAMYATTRRFLDYFNLKNLDELPALADLRDLDALSAQLSIEGADTLLPEQQEAAGADETDEEQADVPIDGMDEALQDADIETETEIAALDSDPDAAVMEAPEIESATDSGTDSESAKNENEDEGELRTESSGSGH